jgi:hypothetical protein
LADCHTPQPGSHQQMTPASTRPVLVTGATGRVGREVVAELLREHTGARALEPTGDGRAAHGRRGRGGRPHRTRVARRVPPGCGHGFPPLDGAARHRPRRRPAFPPGSAVDFTAPNTSGGQPPLTGPRSSAVDPSKGRLRKSSCTSPRRTASPSLSSRVPHTRSPLRHVPFLLPRS